MHFSSYKRLLVDPLIQTTFHTLKSQRLYKPKNRTEVAAAESMAAPLLPKTIPPSLKNPPSLPSTHFTFIPKPLFFSPLDPPPCTKTPNFQTYAKKKNQWLDPFDYGDDPNMEYGSLFADGKQEEDPRPPDNPDNPYGFLKFPMGFNVEVASLPLKIRGDVRRCCCVISGGVYENLLFFPAIQLIKDRYTQMGPKSCSYLLVITSSFLRYFTFMILPFALFQSGTLGFKWTYWHQLEGSRLMS